MKVSRAFVVTILILAALGLGLWFSLRAKSHATSERVAAEIRSVVRGKPPKSSPSEVGSKQTWARVQEFYERRGYHAAWCRGVEITPAALQLLGVLENIGREGIEPERYGYAELADTTKVLRATNPMDPAAPVGSFARWDVRLTRAFLLAAQDLRDGRVPRAALDPDWLTDPRHDDPVGILDEALRQHQPRNALAALVPREPEYERLRDALARYREIESRGGWAILPRGGEVRRGAEGEDVAALRRRLTASEDLPPGATGAGFDRRLEAAVRAFQGRHGLDPTGRVDAPTRTALNVTVQKRIRQIELNLERRRWLPDSLGDPRVEVNIPDFMLAVHDSGRTVLAMRVVVGGVGKQTPVFSDEIAYLELNPSWRLSKRILVNEILPQLDKDPDYLTKQHMTVCYFGGKDTLMVDASAVDWSRARDEDFKYLVAQEPGPENPLGRLKIMCPNEYDVYLHDTPARHLFGVRRRALSHGCVRLERPVDLARRVLGEQPERDSLEAFIGRETWSKIGVKKKVPVHFLYWTAWTDSLNVLQFRGDLYGLDRRLDRALRGDSLATFVVNPPEPDSLRYP